MYLLLVVVFRREIFRNQIGSHILTLNIISIDGYIQQIIEHANKNIKS